MNKKESTGVSPTLQGVEPPEMPQKITESETLEEMALVFKSLSDPSRLRIINALLISELCVHAIAKVMNMSQPAVSHHLTQLRQMRLVKCRRSGKSIYYSLNDYHIQLLFDLCKTHVGEAFNLEPSGH